MNAVVARLAEQGIIWEFIPPRAPHFGGLWEAAVRSFKYHLRRVVGENSLTFEEFSTLAAQIEACLSSRPLCPLNSQGEDSVALTPGHFLIGSAPLSVLESCSDQGERLTLYRRWNLLTQMRNSFWVRWRKEVLNQFQQRSKWLKEKENLQVGDVVILRDEQSPAGRWPLGRVIECFPGSDGLVRVVRVKTAASEFKRPVIKLIKLAVDHELGVAIAQINGSKLLEQGGR
ncbi:uncharacterized protein LOC106640735 [Copidosoma floridanum]|uniref:uncharacterized protein LOC106640735 n=1 Tax=Copidosoma floridanum TaxID=29053 RepID=UPI0006C96022|nr:uncharacterized protein LOC106640735 [Copidosoma floridanum]